MTQIQTEIRRIRKRSLALSYKSSSGDGIPERDVPYIILSVYLLALIDR